MKNLKKLVLKVIAFAMILPVVFCTELSAAAEVEKITLTWEKYVNIPNVTVDGKSCTNLSGIALSEYVVDGKELREMFVVKSNNDQDKAILYYFPRFSQKENFVKIELIDLGGHCNSMTIGSSNIFITRWESGNETGAIKSEILRLSRKVIRNMYSEDKIGQTVGSLNKNSSGVTIIKAYQGTTESNIDGAIDTYTSSIYGISKYGKTVDAYEDGKYFIVSMNRPQENVKRYAKAKLRTRNGKTELVVFTNDTFDVNDGYKNFSVQDFHYFPGKGLFASYWYNQTTVNNGNKTIKYGTSNVILRYTGDLFASDSTISVAKKYYIKGGYSNYFSFEIESLSFKGNRLVVSLNVKHWDDTDDPGCTIEERAQRDTGGGRSEDQIILTEAI